MSTAPTNRGSTPLRLCVVGEMGVHVRRRTVCFAERGHAVRLITDREAALDGVDVVVPRSSLRLPKARVIGDLLAHARAVREWRPDLVHVHYAHRIPAWMMGVLEPHPLVVTVMGGDVYFGERGETSSARAALTRHLLEAADTITTKSDFLADGVARLGPFRGKCFPLRWGVRKSEHDRSRDPAWRRSLGIEDNDRLILSLRNVRPLYGVHLVIEALPLVLRTEPRARLIVLHASSDARYTQRLRDLADHSGVSGRVTFLPEVAPEQVPGLLAQADVSVSLAESDGLPQTLLEALVAGVPSLLSRLGRYDEIVRDGESAVYADRTAVAVASGLIRLLTDRSFHDGVVAGGREVARRIPDFDDEVTRLEAEYRRLVSRPPQRTPLTRRARGLVRFLRLGLG